MSYIDLLLLFPLLYGAYKGFSKGLIVEIATLAGLVVGVYIAIKFSGYTEEFLRDFLNFTSRYLSYIALAVTFLLVAILINLLGKMITRLVDLISLGLVNKLLGTVLGMLKSFLILCVLLLIVDALNTRFHFISEETQMKSLLYRPFLNFAQQMYARIQL